jgi:hypothetical protein
MKRPYQEENKYLVGLLACKSGKPKVSTIKHTLRRRMYANNYA